MSFSGRLIPPAIFQFLRDNPAAKHAERFRGLQLYGPYSRPTNGSKPTIAFVFPTEFKDDANRLYLALRNGVGYFKGLPTTLQVTVEKDSVVPVTGFSLSSHKSPDAQSKAYTDAIFAWVTKNSKKPDVLVVLHPKTAPWQDRTPYYASKAALLSSGLLSQDVTVELIRNENQFQWSVANIALALFVKLGGVPWVVSRRLAAPQVVLGVGQSHIYNPSNRQVDRRYAFTTCVRADGPFEFNVISEPATDRTQYLKSLSQNVQSAIDRAKTLSTPVNQITIHLPKRFGYEERRAIESVLAKQSQESAICIEVLQVTHEEDFFVLDSASKNGLPAKGTFVLLDQRSCVLYTEGREELQPWQNRMPSAIRARYFGNVNDQVFYDLLSQVFDLSQVNYRGFNAASSPVSLVYSSLVAKLLAHLPQGWLEKLHPDDRKQLESRMWFL